MRTAGAIVSVGLRLLAALLLVSMAAAALHDVSRAWDVWYYHLPFAARLSGIVPASSFVFHAANQARYEGFPLLAELLQGLLWRLTGRIESANLVAFASVPLLAWFLRRRFGVPWEASVLALVAIPLVQTHATSCYVDLPANAAAAVLVLLAIEALASDRPVSARTLGLALISAAVAANTKSLLHPIVLVALLALSFCAVKRSPRPRAVRTVAVLALALPLVFATPLKNLVFHHNPYYPVRLEILGHTLPGPEEAYRYAPPWLEDSPRPVRFVCSLLEIGIRPFTSARRWTVDQWMPSDSTGSRLGGFFNAYVVLHLALLLHRLVRDRSRTVVVAAASFGVLTLLTSVMPQSHELRYYLYWMLVLVSLNLWLAQRAGSSRLLALPSVVALGVVVAVTRGGYVYPSGASFAELEREQVNERTLAGVHDGEHVCVEREPWNLLWAAPLHPPHHYVAKEAEQPMDCDGYRPL